MTSHASLRGQDRSNYKHLYKNFLSRKKDENFGPQGSWYVRAPYMAKIKYFAIILKKVLISETVRDRAKQMKKSVIIMVNIMSWEHQNQIIFQNFVKCSKIADFAIFIFSIIDPRGPASVDI